MVMKFRDEVLEKYKMKLFDRKVEDAIKEGLVQDETGVGATRNELQIPVLLDAIEQHKFDACIGGARRDEEKQEQKKDFFLIVMILSMGPKNQRPEIWDLYNGRKNQGEHFRVFPISNWTELDVWNYIKKEKNSHFLIYTFHMKEIAINEMEFGMLMLIMSNLKKVKNLRKRKLDFVQLGM